MQAALSHYRILEQIGAGGMSVVYRAHDERLDRDVALKLLASGALADEAARKRFRKEALALSRLNHPNIATVFDFDTQDGTDFLAEELVRGLSLSAMLTSGPLPEREIINLGTQLCQGLSAAHKQGVIHRDLKPSNIRVTPDARLKILDFGLARIVQPSSPTACTASETQTPAFAGTLPYMAPEQLLTEKVDTSTDIWAVGCVLYEMATGSCPFPGSGPALIDSILHQPAPAASKLNSKLVPGLEAIIQKCLEKEPSLRYASARDIAVDLERLKRDGESDRQGTAAAGLARTTPSMFHPSETAVIAAARQHRWGIGVTALVAILLVLAAGYGIHAFLSRVRAFPFQNFSVHRITDTGKARLVAISPDGKYILDAEEENGEQSLWLHQAPAAAQWKVLPANSNTRIIPPGPFQYLDVRFSPDGSAVYFVRIEIGSSHPALYRVPALGGTPERVVEALDSNITFAPDSRSFAYSLADSPDNGHFRLVIHSVDTGQEKTLVTGPMSDFLKDPAWSPDGREIVSSILQPDHALNWLSGLITVDLATGREHLLLGVPGYVSNPVWLPDGKGLLALLRDKETNYIRCRIVEVSYPGGSPKSVTYDLGDYSGLSLSADAQTLVTVMGQDRYGLYATAASNTTEAEQITPVSNPLVGFSWTPDGQIIFVDQTLSLNMLGLRSPTKPVTSLSQDVIAFSPSACANGRYIVFTAGGLVHAMTSTIWRMDSGGGNMKQLSDGTLDQNGVCSPDGRWVYYLDSLKIVRRVPLEGGKSELVTDRPVLSQLDISPDGKFVVFATTHASLDTSKLGFALVPASYPQGTKVITAQRPPAQHLQGGGPFFTPDGRAIAYAVHDKDADNLWLQPLDGSPGKQITDFKSELILDSHWSFDGSKLGLIRGHTDSDVVLIHDSANSMR